MSNAYYKLYIDSVLLLSKTLVIKNESIADAINLGLTERGISVDSLDLTSWKYYLNLSGQYHVTDTPMRVTSLDTLEDISFDKVTLELHRSTLRGYEYGSRFYKELVAKHPGQEQLILSILNPIDIQTAIGAPDGQILYYDRSLIEENEITVIHRLQRMIDGFMLRWNNVDYSKVDDLYTACHLAVLYMNIPLFILQIRLANCRTEEVHSFHIRQYLASNGRLDSYITHLNKKQMLFLYRNIRYLHRNAGKQDTFEWLTDQVMSERLLPLAEYDLVHNVTNQPNDLYPTIEARRKNLTRYASGNPKDIYSVRELVVKENNVVPGNIQHMDESVEETTRLMKTSIHNSLKTKALESSVVDRSTAHTLKFTDVLLNHWLLLASQDLYPTIIAIDNPHSGEPLWINTKNAFILFVYAFNKAQGTELLRIPRVKANFVRKLTAPTKAEIQQITESKYVPDYFIDYLLRDLKPVTKVISTEGFYEQCRQIHKQWLLHHDFITLREHHVVRGQVEAATYFLYHDRMCVLGPDQTYDSWFAENNIDLSNFDRNEYELLWTTLLSKATGGNLHVTYSISELQRSMLRLMKQLSSYTVQFMDEASGSDMIILDWPAIRVGDLNGSGVNHFKVHQNAVYAKGVSGTGNDRNYVDLSELTYDMSLTDKEFDRSRLDIGLEYNQSKKSHSRSRVIIPTVYATLKPVRPIDLEELITVNQVPEYEYPLVPPADINH